MIMNKMNMLIVAGLMFCGINSAFSMGHEQREILYTLHDLGQDFADVPMVVQNIDMFHSIIAMNIQMTEAKLAAANKSFKKTLKHNAALFAGCQVGTTIFLWAIDSIKRSMPWRLKELNSFVMSYSTLLSSVRGIGFVAGQLFVGLNVYDAWKKRSALQDALALDQEILAQLQELKDSLDQNTEPAEKFLLESAE
jgi:hypothetical protein